MKRPWSAGEKWLLATPVLFGVIFALVSLGPKAARDGMGWPTSVLSTQATTIRSMALSQNGEILAAGSFVRSKGSTSKRAGWAPGSSGKVYLWNARTGERLPTIPPVYMRDRQGFVHGFEICALAFSPSAKQIGFSRVHQNWTLYNVATQKPIWSFPDFINDAEFSRDGRFIALSSDSHVIVVRASDGLIRTRWKRTGPTESHHLAWSPDGSRLASIGTYESGNPIDIHRTDNGRQVLRIEKPKTMSGENVISVAFSPDGKKLISASSLSSWSSEDDFGTLAPLRCYEAATGKLIWQIKADALGGADHVHGSFIDAVVSPDGRIVAAYQYRTGRVLLLDSGTGTITDSRRLRKGDNTQLQASHGLAFSPDGKRLFARGAGSVVFWDLE